MRSIGRERRTPAPTQEVRLRQRIGRFEVRAHLDSGGMADVFLAQGSPAEGLVVVKVLREHLRGLAEVASSLRDEAHILAQIQHPHIVRLVDAGEERGCPWLALQYLEGDHLGAVRKLLGLAGRACPPALGIQVARQAADALQRLHTHRDPRGQPAPVVHRDVSPQNLFLRSDGRLCLLDLGIALHPEREQHTRTGLIKGKVAYMSPEQLAGRPVTGASDLWSLGVTLWELLSGRRLFKHASEFEVMQQVISLPIQPLDQLRPDLPRELLQGVARCLERDPGERLPSGADLLALLAALPASPDPAGLAEEILGARLKKKRALVRSLESSEALQQNLFGDLELADEGGSSELDPGRLSPPARLAGADLPPLPPIDPLQPLPSFEDVVQAEAPSLVGPAPPGAPPAPRKLPLRALAVAAGLTLGALAAGLGLWWWADEPVVTDDPEAPALERAEPLPAATPGARADPPVSRADPPAAGEALAGPTGQVSTLEAAPAAGKHGLLHLACDTPVEVHLGGKRLGRAPLRDVRLPAGRHALVLTSKDGRRKRLELDLEAGRRTRVQVAF
jgi:serine/threonine protein kinase